MPCVRKACLSKDTEVAAEEAEMLKEILCNWAPVGYTATWAQEKVSVGGVVWSCFLGYAAPYALYVSMARWCFRLHEKRPLSALNQNASEHNSHSPVSASSCRFREVVASHWILTEITTTEPLQRHPSSVTQWAREKDILPCPFQGFLVPHNPLKHSAVSTRWGWNVAR